MRLLSFATVNPNRSRCKTVPPSLLFEEDYYEIDGGIRSRAGIRCAMISDTLIYRHGSCPLPFAAPFPSTRQLVLLLVGNCATNRIPIKRPLRPDRFVCA